ncbi:MAG TPA: hypothetical protein VK932_18870 [Kofleriaceae bacterium]|nr:hypothetical protein [Kofleriaceae bacterium]
MARQRRGGGFRPPELRGTLGTLLRTTLEQASFVRDALERGAREGRSRLDDALSGRRRKDALAELGELVLDLIRRGEIDLGELPEAADLVRFLDDLDADSPSADEPADRIAQPPTRGRFDSRARDRSDLPDRARPDDDDDRDARAPRARHSDDDGTVSALRGSSSPAARGSTGSRTSAGRSSPKPAAPPRVWRPSLVDEPPAEPRDPPSARSLPPDPHRKGGIQFDDDEDLADYMHPDDVPPKPPADDDR